MLVISINVGIRITVVIKEGDMGIAISGSQCLLIRVGIAVRGDMIIGQKDVMNLLGHKVMRGIDYLVDRVIIDFQVGQEVAMCEIGFLEDRVMIGYLLGLVVKQEIDSLVDRVMIDCLLGREGMIVIGFPQDRVMFHVIGCLLGLLKIEREILTRG